MSRKTRRERPWGCVLERTGKPGWRVRFAIGGKRIERAAGATREDAEALLRRVRVLHENRRPLEEILAGVFGDAIGTGLTLERAAPLYLVHARATLKPSTFATMTRRLRVMVRAPWARKPIAAVTGADLQAWLLNLQKPRPVRRLRPRRKGETQRQRREDPHRYVVGHLPGASGPTLNRYLDVGASLCAWAREAQLLERDPFAGLKRYSEKGRAREVFLYPEEARALIASCDAATRPVVTCALHTGMRLGEILSLRWENVNLGRGELYVAPETEKTGRGRTVPLTPDLAAELARLNDTRRRIVASDPVFLRADSRPVTAASLKAPFRRAVASCAEIPEGKRRVVTFHALRHTAATVLLAAGVSPADVQQIMGWKTAAMVLRYGHSTERGRADAMGRLGAALSG